MKDTPKTLKIGRLQQRFYVITPLGYEALKWIRAQEFEKRKKAKRDEVQS